MNLFTELQTLYTTNPMFAGVAGAGVVTAASGWVLFQARSLPGRVLQLFLRLAVITVELREGDPGFDSLALWLAKHPDAQKSKRFSVIRAEESNSVQPARPRHVGEAEPKSEYMLTPGSGRHLLRHKGRRFLVHRERAAAAPQGGNGSGQPQRDTITVQTITRSPDVLRRLIDEVTAAVEDKEQIPVFIWKGHWNHLGRRQKRRLDTVYLEGGVKERLLESIETFRARREWYATRGIPWRLGILLDGPPGTGKSTAIAAFAGHFDMPLHIINLSTIYSDTALSEALNSADGIVVLEDADAFKATRERAPAPRPRRRDEYPSDMAAQTAGSPEDEGNGITLSGLLNAIDGIASKDGRILFITSNHPDILDAALLRPGRIDVRAHLGLAHAETAQAMFERWFPDRDPTPFLREIAPLLPLSPAALQNRLLEMEGSAEIVPLRKTATA